MTATLPLNLTGRFNGERPFHVARSVSEPNGLFVRVGRQFESDSRVHLSKESAERLRDWLNDRYPVEALSARLGVAEAKALIERAIAAEGEDFVYKADERGPDGKNGVACNYFENGAPSCIVGYALSYLGMKAESAPQWVRDNIAVSAAGDHEDEHFTEEAREFLGRMQTMQDAGTSWGDALSECRVAGVVE